MESSEAPVWTALVLEVADALAEELAGMLEEGSLGCEIGRASAGRSRVRIYCSSAQQAERLRERSAECLRSLGERSTAYLEGVRDERWVERYQSSLRPFAVGTRFVVVPGEEPRSAAHDGRIPLRLVPGQAFGTGEHATTKLCVEALERFVSPGSRWLDLGTGTGILALVAAHMGAREVLARDSDPDAVEVARQVRVANRMEARIRIELGSGEGLEAAAFDGVVANIAAPYFLERAPELRSSLRPGAVLVAAGLLDGDVPEVGRAFARAGLDPLEERSLGEWVLLAARRPEA